MRRLQPMVALRYVASGFQPSAEEVALTAVLALLAVSLETFGYEAILNALGAAGIGRRSEEAQVIRARETALRGTTRRLSG